MYLIENNIRRIKKKLKFNLSKKALTKSTGRCVKSRRNYKSECHTELSRG